MSAIRFTAVGSMCLALALASMAGGAAPAADGSVHGRSAAMGAFQVTHPGTAFYTTDGRITTVYGAAFSRGISPVASADGFVNKNAGLFGVAAGNLVPGSLAGDGLAVREFMPDLNDGHLRFTLVSYLQTSGGIPVFRADLRLLVRNEAGFPLVLARSGLRELGGFVVNEGAAAAPNVAAAQANAAELFPGLGNFSNPQVVVWAGTEEAAAAPALAVAFEGTAGDKYAGGYGKWLILADAATGEVLYTEDQIRQIDVTGSVKGMATPGKKADICETEILTAMAHARVSIGATVAYADANGNFTIPNAGSTAVSVSSGDRGKFFQVFTGAADPELITTSVTPPGPANFVHNLPNTNATHRSGVNAYIQANVVRDFTLAYCPTYPTIVNQTEPNASAFRVNINVVGTCNAYYDGSSINFYAAGGGCPSTAFGDVVWHEYGHHLVQVAGSGQDQYGEGMGDTVGVVISDEPVLGYGFQNNCAAGIRTANNTKQYPQSGEIHDAGQLISGCVWSTRNALIGPYPSTYRDIIGSLTVNSILLHSGGAITPQITIDFLTLDDDNADISDGTPHYSQINAGFSAHNMPAPTLSLLKFVYPGGRPAAISALGGVMFTVEVQAQGGTPQPNTGVLYVDPENNGTYVQYTMGQSSPNVYEANFPATPCGSTVRYYVSARTTTNATMTNPGTAPAAYYSALTASSVTTIFSDNFQTNLGWTVSNTAGLTTGAWQRGVPADTSGSAPFTDHDGSGQCYVTDNRASASLGQYDIDGGTTTLTSPTINAAVAAAAITYARWFSNNLGASPDDDQYIVQVSGNNGATWQNLDVVGPNGGAEQHGGWYSKTFGLPAAVLTSQFKVRFSVGDTALPSVTDGGLDAVSIQSVSCFCPADYNQDGFVDGIDYDMFNNDFESSDPVQQMNADYNGDGFVDGIDYDLFNNDFAAGC